MLRKLRNKIFGVSESKEVAKNRLQMLLVQDRGGISSNEMESFRMDLIGVLKKYFVLREDEISIEWRRDSSSTAMLINTPVCGRPKLVAKPGNGGKKTSKGKKNGKKAANTR